MIVKHHYESISGYYLLKQIKRAAIDGVYASSSNTPGKNFVLGYLSDLIEGFRSKP